MNFNQLSKYVWQKYGLKFTPLIPGSTTSYILKTPLASGYFAMMSRIPKANLGLAGSGNLPVLDLKCGNFSVMIKDLPGFTGAYRLDDPQWVGTILTGRRNEKNIKNALDYAFKLAMNGSKRPLMDKQYIVLPGQKEESKYQAQKIKPRSEVKKKENPAEPALIRKMRASYDYSVLPRKGRSKNFYHQGQIAANYKDNFANTAAFARFYPTYHDMSLSQLRTYFTWRTKLRAGHYERTSLSYAYVYIYELLNNIGVKTPQEGFKQLMSFCKNYEAKFAPEMSENLNQWLQDYVLYYHLGTDAKKIAFKTELKRDHEYHVLLQPETSNAQELLKILLHLAPYADKCLSYKKLGKKFAPLVYAIWQQLIALKKQKGPSFFHQYIAFRNLLQKHLFAGAVFYFKPRQQLTSYQVDEERQYLYQNGRWYGSYLIANKGQKTGLNLLLHEIDRLTRQAFHLGRNLKPRKLEKAYLKAIALGIRKFQQAEEIARRPKIKIDFSQLQQIRSDASVTRDSLLTEEEKDAEQEDSKEEVKKQPPVQKEPEPAPVKKEAQPDSHGLQPQQLHFLLALLKHEDWQSYLRKHHLMASILADQINNQLFDDIGDSVIEFDENDQPRIIADYEDDLKEMFLR